MSTPELSIIVFAFNEAENVEHVLGELCAWLTEHEPSSEIVFVDDGSSDATSEAAARALASFPSQLVRHERNRGIGAAIKSGVRLCRGAWVTFLPADGQIEPAAVGTLRDKAKQTGAELVFSVYADRNDGLDRKLLSFGVRALIFAVHGVRMECDGPYLFRRELFVPEQLPSDTFFLNFEFPIRMIVRGVRTAGVVIRCRQRRAGHSKSTGLRRIGLVARDLVDFRVRRFLER